MVFEAVATVAEAGANFDFVLARRTPERPGDGILFVAPVKGAKAAKAAQAAGFAKPGDIHPLRIEGADKAGSMAAIARALADAGISFRGLSAAAIGRKFVAYLALDSAEAAAKAASVIRKLS